jgi:hypothetical protein
VLSLLRQPDAGNAIIDAPQAEPAESLKDRPDAKRPKSLAAAEPLLVDTAVAAKACGVSSASWFRLKASGRTPGPIKLRRRVLYRLADLKLWVAMGCPDRKEFEARRAAATRT